MRKLGILLLAVALLILLTTRSGPSSTPVTYDPFDTGWRGCSEFFRILQEEHAAKLLTTSYSVLAQYKDAVLFIFGPTEPFSASEKQQLIQFVKEGGILIIVADIDGTGSNLDVFGARIVPALLRDPGSYEKRPDFVVLKDLRGNLFRGVSSILTNCPSYLTSSRSVLGIPTLEAAAYTSRQAYPDLNRNGSRDPDEESSSYPVIAAFRYSEARGKVVFIADPGIFINDIIQRNLAFVRALLNWAAQPEETSLGISAGKAVLLDLTHTGHKPEIWLWSTWLTDKFLPLSLAVVIMVAWSGWSRKQKPVTRPEGRLITEMRRCTKLSRAKTRSDFSLPLLVCYRHFLRKCSRLMGVEPTAEGVLRALQDNLPKEAENAARVIATCHLVEQRVLTVDVETAEKLIKELREMETKVEAWSRR